MSNSCAVDPRPARSNETSEPQDNDQIEDQDQMEEKDQIEPLSEIKDNLLGPAKRQSVEWKD